MWLTLRNEEMTRGFLLKKGAGYANLKMPCVYSTQKTVTSHIKMRLVFVFCTQQRRFVEHLPWV